MASPQKRQKKLQKKNSKRKEKKQLIVRDQQQSVSQQLTRAAHAPIVDCWRYTTLFDQGMGQIVISRELPNGMMAVGSFLLDVYCLGVKDAFGEVVGKATYRERFGSHQLPQPKVDMEPAAARKLVEDAVDYARELGFSPHADYEVAKLIFGDIDAEQCDEEFTFGKDGKPLFINGPYENMARVRQILHTLERNCGVGNYEHVLLAGPGGQIDPDGGKVLDYEPED